MYLFIFSNFLVTLKLVWSNLYIDKGHNVQDTKYFAHLSYVSYIYKYIMPANAKSLKNILSYWILNKPLTFNNFSHSSYILSPVLSNSINFFLSLHRCLIPALPKWWIHHITSQLAVKEWQHEGILPSKPPGHRDETETGDHLQIRENIFWRVSPSDFCVQWWGPGCGESRGQRGSGKKKKRMCCVRSGSG